MPPKRKADILANATSANNYTNTAGHAPNKRSRISKPDTNAILNNIEPSKNEYVDAHDYNRSGPEETSSVVDRRYYPAEMSNERCAMYNNNEILRPIQGLLNSLKDTESERNKIRSAKKDDKEEAVLHWFKRDLRIRDNAALSKAVALAKEKNIGVICVWIMSPQDWEAHLVSPVKCDFEIRSIGLLQKELDELDIPLYMETVEKRKKVPKRLVELAQQWRVKNAFCNMEYEPDELRREEQLVKLMLDEGINFEPMHDDTVVPPGHLKTGVGRQFAVYSPWFRVWVSHLHSNPKLLEERPIPTKNPSGFRQKFNGLFKSQVPEAPPSKSLTREEKDKFHHLWPAGEAAAIDRLEKFLTEKVDQYSDTRNFPSLNSTSRISVHLSAGTLAARTCIRMARAVNSTKKLDSGNQGIKSWISEVAWRDFYRHILAHWPYVCMNKPFKYEYTNVEWEYNEAHFDAWTKGRTGYPIVDAAMRSLLSTGYMHNRLRMVSASFLAKHLLLDWRRGERFFMTHLIDGDFASNNGGWGFSASTGVDPQPYFRIFNPWLQSEKFDAEGEFIRTWVEELRDVEGKGVHNPYEVGGKAAELATKNGYPKPIVEHKFARARCLARYKSGLGRDTA